MGTPNIADKVVVITGASSGIGESTAKLLARQGAKVALGARRKDRIDAVAKRFRPQAVRLSASPWTSRSALKWKHSSKELSTVSAAAMSW